MDLSKKTDAEIYTWIHNHERQGATRALLYEALVAERARRAKAMQGLDLDRSLALLREAAIAQVCTTYGALAAASGVDWKIARHHMNGPGGHLDQLLDICHARGMPLLSAICVNQRNVENGLLGEEALAGFVAGARRLGLAVHDAVGFHRECRDRCWEWGRDQGLSR